MQKDVIYVDVDDDITAIIDKVKASPHKIIALVPPKRVGVLQSAVNLRLINRAASQKDKRLVVITGNSALAGLAAAASIPVAKNLQSKPELAEVPALKVDDGDDIIDGAQLPVGEHAGIKEAEDPAAASDVAAAGLVTANETRKATPPASGKAPKVKAKRGVAVPNFDTFRKKLVLIIAAAILLVGFLVWAIFFAPRATVNVTTRTTDAAVSQQITLDPSAETSAASSVIKATTKSQGDDISIDFKATGEKNIGKKATGTVEFTNNTQSSKTVSAGTVLTTSGGLAFELDETVSIPGGTISCNPFPNCSGVPGTAEGDVTASEPGTKYNAATGDLDGAPSSVDADFTGPTSGGTDKTVAVVTRSDIDQARREANDAIDRDNAVASLKEQLGEEYVVLEDSLQVDTSKLKSSVGVDKEAPNGEAEYSGEVTFTLYAVAVEELDDYLEAVIEQQIDDKDTQQVYETGAKQAQFTNVDSTDDGVRASLSTNGKIGPKIDEEQVKQQAAGKRIGDIKSSIEVIDGVDSVDVTLSPFWVNTAPKDVDKIKVEFTLEDD